MKAIITGLIHSLRNELITKQDSFVNDLIEVRHLLTAFFENVFFGIIESQKSFPILSRFVFLILCMLPRLFGNLILDSYQIFCETWDFVYYSRIYLCCGGALGPLVPYIVTIILFLVIMVVVEYYGFKFILDMIQKFVQEQGWSSSLS